MAKNVTLTGADDGTVEVDLDGRIFALNDEVTNVSQDNVDRLTALPGLHFRVTDPKKEG
jgi:hypothetical protein